ncbi:MAG: D-3-phosphoglycerate dehydrogenase [Limisphaerales bacterium]|nr:MAG: D-3-phosphoglycerate dehydrogenase [Limisphaerales bacterium]KAG0507186.1 MAG: D-3-phosphoglycerate dehydrogenase [Limisphaerales bacterium]TXT46975.1 MAG: D-3-phosphoglycerate dehydrogenase [Limisphaerales bacterium]
MKVLICDPISPKGIELFRQRPEFQVTVLDKRLSEAELLPIVTDVEAMVVRSETKVTKKVLEAAAKLRVVGRAGVGVDNVDVEAATQRGVVVMNTPAGNTLTTAELSFAMILNLARKVPQAHGSMVAGKWDRKLFMGVELHGKTLGVLGAGRIGTEVGKRALAFGMKVLAYDPFLTEGRAKALGFELASDVDTIYEHADFITIHLPVTEQTRGMLNTSAFSKMKPGVRIVNCARGEIIAENDLLAALDSKKVAAAALDVFCVEPMAADHPFRKHPSLILTPHLGASSEEAQEKCGIEVAEVITAYLLTGEVRNAVNLPYLDAKTYEQVKPYMALGEALGKLLAQVVPQQIDRAHITYGGKAQELPNIDPITRAVLMGFLARAAVKDLNPINVRGIAGTLGITVEEKRSNEPVTFNEWLHVQLFKGDEKVGSAGGTFFGSPNNPRIVRLFSNPLEIPLHGTFLMFNNLDRPGIVGHVGTVLGKHGVNIANLSLSRDHAGGHALSVFHVDSEPPVELLEELRRDPVFSNVRVVKL